LSQRNAAVRGQRKICVVRFRYGSHRMTTLTLLFAILLCVVNAALWTVYTQLPLASAGWLAAAAACVWLQKWSRK
jgi:hypothetical protein